MHTIMHFMQELCNNYASYAKITQKLRKNYAKITQKLEITQKLRMCV